MKRAELWVGLALVVAVVALALVSFVWTPFGPTAVGSAPRLQPPGWPHVLGTDHMGIDTFSRILVGARSALYVGIIAVGIAALVGVPLGILAAWLPRWGAEAMMRATDVAYAFPALLLAIAAYLGHVGPDLWLGVVKLGPWLLHGSRLMLHDLRRHRVVLVLVAGVWVLALIRLFAHHVPVLPLLFNWTPSLPYKVAFVDYRSGAIVRGDLVVYAFEGPAGLQAYPSAVLFSPVAVLKLPSAVAFVPVAHAPAPTAVESP